MSMSIYELTIVNVYMLKAKTRNNNYGLHSEGR